MTDETSPQLSAWRGDFGAAYRQRNPVEETAVVARARMWSRILRATDAQPPQEVLEAGANVGINLHALKRVCPARLMAVEPNDAARNVLAESGVLDRSDVHEGTLQSLPLGDAAADLVFTSGVLIHVAPDDLPAAFSEIVRVARRYIVLVEYFSDQPEEIEYRGQKGLLFRRDFGGALLDAHPSLTCLDYGFFWRRLTGLGNLTWWLFRKP
ncbi:MAG: pseudaminic acid biosynthesis-associated methylase [Pseudomonadota bacterium]